MKKLPIGIQSFEVMRESDFLYIDKTEHIYKLVNSGMYYFLSRPRRFGKSLLVSTLKCLFQGRRELFDGLWLAEYTNWAWVEHPIINLDFNRISHDTPERLEQGLEEALEAIACSYGVSLGSSLLKERFGNLILELNRKYHQPVVILVDEYDKPMIDHLGKGEKGLDIAKTNRDILKSVFGVIKGGDIAPILRFVCLTGISRFSKVSIFSELNNLSDISMDERYAALLGYTGEELERYFQDYISDFAAHLSIPAADLLERLTAQYNGYRFSTKNAKVYNPFSILRAFDQQAFGNYWFETATPTFLVNLLREKNYPLSQIETLEVTESVFGAYDLDNLQPEAMLFQTGYLTVKDVQGRIFTLSYPNQEVKISFTECLLRSYEAPGSGLMSAQIVRLAQYLEREELDAFFETINAIYASIPYDKMTTLNEAYFHTLFYLMVSASGADARSEVLGHKGRIDLAILFADKVFVIEFKCGQGAEAALQQIRAKGYADRYRQTGRKVFLLGINFDVAKREVGEWQLALL